MKHSLNEYLFVINTFKWQRVSVEVAFPEVTKVLDYCKKQYLNYDAYYCVLCSSFDDYLKYFFHGNNAFRILLKVNNQYEEDAYLVRSFRAEIAGAMKYGCSFTEALREFDLLY